LVRVGVAWANAGDLDTTFNGTGKVTTAFGSRAAFANAVAIQSDGKIVAAGEGLFGSAPSVGRFTLARYDSDGTLDTAFGSDGTGKVTTAIGTQSGALSVAIQSNGKIVSAGGATVNGHDRFALARYDANGALDTTFGTHGNGTVTTLLGSNATARGVALQTNGKIVAAGGATVNGHDRFALARYDADGALDTTFGPRGNGKVIAPRIGQYGSYARALAIQSNGKIVAAGYAKKNDHAHFALVRFDSQGTLDTTFGPNGNGEVFTQMVGGSFAHAVAIQSDGKIVVAGWARVKGHDRFALARYDSDGTLDDAFGSHGKVTTVIGSGAFGYAVAIQSDGKIVAGGSALLGGNTRFTLVRYDSDGTLDGTFGPRGNGKVTTAIGFGPYVLALAIQSDGKIVAAGATEVSHHHRFTLARYLAE
jgi:uncharacterized delta-60 repeat protein